jgi:hypothetical protein
VARLSNAALGLAPGDIEASDVKSFSATSDALMAMRIRSNSDVPAGMFGGLANDVNPAIAVGQNEVLIAPAGSGAYRRGATSTAVDNASAKNLIFQRH